MKKVTNKLLLFIFITLTIGFLAGCDSDSGTESNEPGSVVGTWQLTSAVLYNTPVGTMTLTAEIFLDNSGTGAETSVLQFNEDGTASVTTNYEDGSEETIGGTWSTNGDNITVVGAGLDDTMTYEVSGNTLTLTLIMPIDFFGDGNEIDVTIDMIYNRI